MRGLNYDDHFTSRVGSSLITPASDALFSVWNPLNILDQREQCKSALDHQPVKHTFQNYLHMRHDLLDFHDILDGVSTGSVCSLHSGQVSATGGVCEDRKGVCADGEAL